MVNWYSHSLRVCHEQWNYFLESKCSQYVMYFATCLSCIEWKNNIATSFCQQPGNGLTLPYKHTANHPIYKGIFKTPLYALLMDSSDVQKEKKNKRKSRAQGQQLLTCTRVFFPKKTHKNKQTKKKIWKEWNSRGHVASRASSVPLHPRAARPAMRVGRCVFGFAGWMEACDRHHGRAGSQYEQTHV